MCGIIGASFPKGQKYNTEKLKILMMWNQIERGKDSTGWFTPEGGIEKDNSKAVEFIIKNPIPESNLFIGHVRSMTIGVNSKKNAHPFAYGNIVGVHNGTLINHWGLCNLNGLSSGDYDVDSQVIYALMNKLQSPMFLSTVKGAMALLWSDTMTETMYVYRNKERPLYVGRWEDGLYISSIKESLEIIECKNIKEFKDDTLYTIKDGVIQDKTIKISYKADKNSKRVGYSTILRCNEEVPKVDNFIDKWVHCNWTTWATIGRDQKTSVQFIKGQWYLCDDVSAANEYELFMKVGKGEKTLNYAIYTNNFDLKDSLIEKGDEVIVMNGVYSSKTDKLIFPKGTLLTCKSVNFSEDINVDPDSYGCYSKTNPKSIWDIPSYMIRRVLPSEKVKLDPEEGLSIEEMQDRLAAMANTPPPLAVVLANSNLNKEESDIDDSKIEDINEDLDSPFINDEERLNASIPWIEYADLVDGAKKYIKVIKGVLLASKGFDDPYVKGKMITTSLQNLIRLDEFIKTKDQEVEDFLNESLHPELNETVV